MAYLITRITILLFLISISIPSIFSHPFDPLSELEIEKVASIIKSRSNLIDIKFHYFGIHEPSKPAVLSWLANPRSPPPPREALAVVRAAGETHEFVVGLDSGRILSTRVYDGTGFPTLSIEEQEEAIELSLKHAPLVAAIERRGLNLSEIVGSVFTIGWYGESARETKRVVKVLYFYGENSVNVWVRPVEGIETVVDLDRMVVTEFKDLRVCVMPKVDGTDYRSSGMRPPYVAETNPITVQQPKGPSFVIRGHTLSWANWDLHVGFDMRVGIVISSASIYDLDQRKKRQVLYQGHISELFVPYQDPTEEWYYRTFLDAGEFGMGSSAVPLEPLHDCPANAVLFDAYYGGPDGNRVKLPNAYCIFEKSAGNIAWRHTESAIPGKKIREVRPDVSLMIRMIAVIGNYDYILDWEFTKSGSIKFKVSLTGIMEAKTTAYKHTSEIKEEIYGALAAANTIGVNHDHFITYYLDLDIDGQDNSFVKSKLKSFKSDGSTPRKSYWSVVDELVHNELDARLRPTEPTEFNIVNPNKETAIGNKVGYRLIPGPAAPPLLSDDDFPQIRGALSDYNIWVTPYNRSEKWAGGMYVDRSRGDQTLKILTERNRDISNKDIVLWHTIGFHHHPTQDEFPIMPTLSGGFELRPSNFFERNPILKMKAP
ncbi:primary amine oxidase-like [Momordica charantia]|uniref:Amine oxidase n=1 Tax=Momordica charantia TaxID=3673 RepID=A0A6J1CCV5_MOMCH|nr:primary amine oxidase-like [Momordica charantia]